jgi:hypothetical protein
VPPAAAGIGLTVQMQEQLTAVAFFPWHPAQKSVTRPDSWGG